MFTACCSYFCTFRRQISSGMVTRRYIFWHISIISTTACPTLCSHTSTHVMHQVRSFAGNKCVMSHSSVCGIPLGRHTNIFSKTIKQSTFRKCPHVYHRQLRILQRLTLSRRNEFYIFTTVFIVYNFRASDLISLVNLSFD